MGRLVFRVFFLHLRKCAAALPATAQQKTVKSITLSVKDSNRLDGTAKPVQGSLASFRPARHSQSVGPAAQERVFPDPLPDRSKDTRSRDKTSRIAAELKRLCPPQFLRTGISPHAAFVLNVAKVKRDGYLARAKSPEIARAFGTGKLPIPEKLTGNEHRCQRANCVLPAKTTDKEI